MYFQNLNVYTTLKIAFLFTASIQTKPPYYQILSSNNW